MGGGFYNWTTREPPARSEIIAIRHEARELFKKSYHRTTVYVHAIPSSGGAVWANYERETIYITSETFSEFIHCSHGEFPQGMKVPFDFSEVQFRD
jgi:hypothetical protein